MTRKLNEDTLTEQPVIEWPNEKNPVIPAKRDKELLE